MGFLDFLFGKPKTYESSSGSRRGLPAVRSSSALTTTQKKINVLRLLIGDVITYEATDYVVQSRYVYESHGFRWYSYHLVDSISGQKLWVDAQDEDELEVAVVEPVKMELSAPIPDSLFHDGRKYYLDEHGYANVSIETQDSEPRFVEVEYWDYYDDSEEYTLGVERWGNDIEVSAGEYIEPYELTILPGAD